MTFIVPLQDFLFMNSLVQLLLIFLDLLPDGFQRLNGSKSICGVNVAGLVCNQLGDQHDPTGQIARRKTNPLGISMLYVPQKDPKIMKLI